jgi:putative peptidoglycan lipid II flippase
MSLGAAALLLSSAVFLSRVIGYLREVFVASRFGANGETDAFYAAFTIPDVLNYFLAGGTLSITFLPLYARYLAAHDEAQANHVLSVIATWVLGVLALLVLVGELVAGTVVAHVFDGLSPAALASCIRYTRILLPAQLCFFAGGLLSATLYARGHFKAAAIAPLLYNVGIIAGGLILGGSLGTESLVWGALVGAFAGPFLVPAVAAWRAGARPRPSLAVRHPALREWLVQTLPLMLGVSLVTADDWILRYFAQGNEGQISLLNYAKRLVAVPIAVVGQAIGQASMPFFARLFATGQREELCDTFVRTARTAGVWALLLSAWIAALAEPLTDLLYRWGAFSLGKVSPTALYVAIFCAAVPLFTLQGLMARAFYAAGNTLTPMVAGTVVTVLALPLYKVLFVSFGVVGLAIASGLGILCHTVSLALLLPRVLPELRPRAPSALSGLLCAAALALVAGGASFAAAELALDRLRRATSLHLADVLVCALGSLVFLGVVFALAKRLGVDEPASALHKVRRRRHS